MVKNKADSISSYLNTPDPKMIREKLRNSIAHSVEATSSYIFHRKLNGKIIPQIEYILPSHPYEYLNYVIKDVIELIEFMNEITNAMYDYRNNN